MTAQQFEIKMIDSLLSVEINFTALFLLFSPRDILLIPEELTTQKPFRFQPKVSHPKSQGRSSHQTRIRSNSKVTVPKPFQMMLREEERKRHKVRTRSEIELENMLLRRELEELQECQKKFRASPAPAHTHQPLYEMISRRSVQQNNRGRSGSNNTKHDTKSIKASATASTQPFRFLEREKRKREARIVAELGNLGPKEERWAFKARPMPSSVYGARHKADTKNTSRRPPFSTVCTLEREATEGQSDPNSDPESDVLHSKSDTSPASSRPQRCPSSIEISIQMVKEREWSNADPLKASACTEPVFPNKSDYISV